MDPNSSAPYPRAFQILPIEINIQIASYLDDRDLGHFALVCSDTYASIHCHGSPIWRELFLNCFDLTPGLTNDDLKTKYQERKKILRRGASFTQGTKSSEKRCLMVIRDLIVESYFSSQIVDGSGDLVTCRNLQQIERFLCNTDLLQTILRPRYMTGTGPTQLLSIIQIMIAHFRLDLRRPSPTLGFQDSQKLVYETARQSPLFIGRNRSEINLKWIGAALNYFKYHLTGPSQSLHASWTDLADSQKPKAWTKRLDNGVAKLGRRWKGLYGYVLASDVEKIRREGEESYDGTVIEDCFNEDSRNTPFQTMLLEFPDSLNMKQWPAFFESHLRSVSHPMTRHKSKSPKVPQTRSGLAPSNMAPQHAAHSDRGTVGGLQFAGIGKDMGRFCARGWINGLPPQQGIPGWMRITMMKSFMTQEDDEGESDDEDDDDPFGMKMPGQGSQSWDLSSVSAQDLWGYEGVVLPGGQIMIGRWWDVDLMDYGAGVGFGPARPKNLDEIECYCGPFMFWCVDGAEEDDDLDMGIL